MYSDVAVSQAKVREALNSTDCCDVVTRVIVPGTVVDVVDDEDDDDVVPPRFDRAVFNPSKY